jgi:MerR family transcriptional regulator, light-induced transcriptional regulator
MTADPRSAQGLTIGDLARRSGLTPATLRAWETRHGFPRPQRLPSGHRRYDEQDLALVRQVLRRKAAGVRLESAIAEAAAARRTPMTSVFAELRRGYPQIDVQPLRKSTLLALTWAMEDECCARAQQPSLFAAFQHERFFGQAEARWADLARTARSTVVFADFATDGSHRSTSGAACVHLPREAPMRREWSLVCDAPDHRAALAAWELPGQSQTRDADRMFECLWTLEPAAVRDASRACAALVADLAPHLAEGLDDLDTLPSEPSDDLRSATTMFTRLLGYVDKYR